jgi:hypothetical protein
MFAALNPFQNHYFHPNMVYTSTYTYILCTDAVCSGMYFGHNHTSFPIRPNLNQPCDTSESHWQLRAGAAPFITTYQSEFQTRPLNLKEHDMNIKKLDY